MGLFFGVMAGAVAFVVAMTLPYDWWQIAPSRQRNTPIGRLLGTVLDVSLRNLLLRALLLAILGFISLIMAVWLPIMAGVAIAGILLIDIARLVTGRHRSDQASTIGAIIVILVAVVFAIGALAPLRVFVPLLYVLRGYPAGSFLEAFSIGSEWTVIDTVIGMCGLVGVVSWIALDAIWRSRQARQIDNLATSTIGSLAIGLVEIKGTVRPLDGMDSHPAIEVTVGMTDYLEPKQTINRFVLDDGTGTVVVDATSCRVRAGWIAPIGTIFGAREILLTRRVSHDDRYDQVTKQLWYGDRVYVIGCAERDASGTLVVRPASRSGWNETVWRTLFGAIAPPKGRDIHDVFFVADGGERVAKTHIMRGFRTVALAGCLWAIASVGSIWSAQQSWRQVPPLDSWREAYWRGRPDDPGRRTRFERHMKALDVRSGAAIPALLEAMTYDDVRYKDLATWKLIPLIRNHSGLASHAVPLLVANLESDDAMFRQSTILALGAFGRDADAAVPALIEQLATTKTNTYKVTPEIIRMQAASALGSIGGRARGAIPALRRALADRSRAVQDAAADALRRIETDVF